MRTTDGALKQVAIRLTEGPENISFVSQNILPLFFPVLNQIAGQGTVGCPASYELKQTLSAGDDDRCFDAARRIPCENNHKRNAPVGDHPLI